MNNRFKSIMNNRFYRNLKPEQFKPRFGVQIQTFKKMVNALEQFRLENSQDQRGRRSALTLEEQVKSGLGILARISNLFSYRDKLGSIRINDLPNCN